MSTGINIASSSGLTVGTTTVTSGTDGRVFFQAGGVVQQDSAFFWDNTNKRLGVGATPSTSVRLDVRAQGALSTDIAFRVRNSADTQNIVSFHGDGRFLIGQNASNACTGGTPQYAIAIGASAAVSGASETYGSPIAIGYNSSATSYNGISIGNGSSGSGIAIGSGAASKDYESVVIGGTNTGGGFRTVTVGFSASNTGYQGSAIGYDVNNTGDAAFTVGTFFTSSLSQSFVYGNTNIKFLVNNNSNLVLAKDAPITEANKATYFDTAATNTITIHNGTAPTTNIATAGQLYAESGTLRYRDSAGTITNVGGSVQSVASAATVTPVYTNKFVKVTAQAAALALANPTGTWAEGQDLMIRIKDNGTARAITWDTNYRAIGVTLPTTTVISKTTYVGVIYNSTDGKWDVIGVTTEV